LGVFIDTSALAKRYVQEPGYEELKVGKAFKAAGEKLGYEIFRDATVGHRFDRTDLMLAKEIRAKIYKFLAKYLSPEHPI
jgi:hypothetical protein